MAAFFYAYYGLLAFTKLDRLQRAFNTLTDLFDWVGLIKNLGKTVRVGRKLFRGIQETYYGGGYYAPLLPALTHAVPVVKLEAGSKATEKPPAADA